MTWIIAAAAEPAKAVVESVSAGAAAALPAAQGLVVAAPDYGWITILVAALAAAAVALIPAIIAAILQVRAANRMALDVKKLKEEDILELKEGLAETKAQAVTTAEAVDGKMTEVVKIISEKVRAETTVDQMNAQKLREADKVLAAVEPIAAHVIAPGNGGAADSSPSERALLEKIMALVAEHRK